MATFSILVPLCSVLLGADDTAKVRESAPSIDIVFAPHGGHPDLEKPFSLIQLDKEGGFSTSSGANIRDETLSTLFTQRKKDGIRVIVIDVATPKEMSVRKMSDAVERLKRSAPKGTRARLIIRLEP